MRNTFLLIAFLAVPALFAGERSDTIKGAHPFDVDANAEGVSSDLAKWSLIFDAGFNTFDGDFNSEMKHPVYAPSVGISAEYSFNPYIGIGLGYSFDMFRVSGNASAAPVLLQGFSHRVNAYLPIDLVTCFAPYATKKVFNLHLLLGGGAGWYRRTTYFAQADRGNTQNVAPQYMDKYAFSPFFAVGANAEFNLGRSTALGIKAVYNYYTSDDIDKRTGGASTNNDGLANVAVSLRYKIGAQCHTHTRNTSAIAPRLQALQSEQQAPHNSEMICTAAHRTDTLYISRTDTIALCSNQPPQQDEVPRYFAYFDQGKATLTDPILIAIQQAAASLQHDTTLCALIVGYCDNTGSASYNQQLSQQRADIVANELANEYNIPTDRIHAHGAGIIIGSHNKTAYAPNRRVEITLLHKDAFNHHVQQAEQANNAVDAKACNLDPTPSPTPAQGAVYSAATTAQPTPCNTPDTVVVKQGMTLSKLARIYYYNTNLWTIIYNANKHTIQNPDMLTEGTTLIIPKINK